MKRVRGEKVLSSNSAANLAALRVARGFSWSWLSERLTEAGQPIPVLGLTRIISGTRRLDIDEAYAIAAILGTAVESMAREPCCGQCLGVPPSGFSCLSCGATNGEVDR